MYDNNIRGYDNVGALFIMEENPITNDSSSPYCFWTGSILNSEYTRNVLKDDYFGPTVIQVMAGVLAGVSWMLGNKHKGLVFGEDLDDDFILKLAKKYFPRWICRFYIDKECSICFEKIFFLHISTFCNNNHPFHDFCYY